MPCSILADGPLWDLAEDKASTLACAGGDALFRLDRPDMPTAARFELRFRSIEVQPDLVASHEPGGHGAVVAGKHRFALPRDIGCA